MSLPVPPLPPESADVAQLRELLGHVHTCWDNERRLLARQLHDSMGSSLTALTMHLGLLAAKLPQEPALLDRAAQMKNLLHTIIDTNRQMQHQLWNDKLEFLGVRVALSELVEQFGQQHQLTARCSLPEEEPMCPRGHSVVLLRTLEEGLRNVLAHAQASEIEVIVDDNDEQIMLTVRDNGVGPLPGDGEDDSAVRYSLRALRERALYLGGSLNLLAATPGPGACLTVILPKPAPAA
ncbi:sensor histidine kinase [Massilia sp. NR 4-1]|uniref:sensor histidine kinase n=1 Tax=Massilia sp. NR 4-1 TaxID=1678028 RepID=UPI00067B710E|nr:histidine kinase [Massilia sp. NR 4-1]AKU21504.1 histidine kinase [Massilia sp. NR 4-1]